MRVAVLSAFFLSLISFVHFARSHPIITQEHRSLRAAGRPSLLGLDTNDDNNNHYTINNGNDDDGGECILLAPTSCEACVSLPLREGLNATFCAPNTCFACRDNASSPITGSCSESCPRASKNGVNVAGLIFSFVLMIFCPLCILFGVMYLVAMRCRSKVAANTPVPATVTQVAPLPLSSAHVDGCSASPPVVVSVQIVGTDAEGVEMSSADLVSAQPVCVSLAAPKPTNAIVATPVP